MDGQALDLPDASFDAAVSIFGVMLFPDWRAGLREMARVTRPGGSVAVAVWRHSHGASFNMLVATAIRDLYPDLVLPDLAPGMAALSDAGRLSAALISAGYADPSVEEVVHDFLMETSSLDDPNQVFGLFPFANPLDAGQRDSVMGEVRVRAERNRVGTQFRIPSTALVATARRS